VVTLRSWQPRGEGAMAEMPGIAVADSAEQAVSAALASMGQSL